MSEGLAGNLLTPVPRRAPVRGLGVLAIAASVGALVTGGLGAAWTAAPEATGYAHLEALALERSGGDLDRQGTATAHGPDGAVERSITGRKFLAVARELFDRFAGPEADDVVFPPKVIGVGLEDPLVAPLTSRLGWPYCESVSILVVSQGGSPLKHAIPVETLPVGPGSGPVCGGLYGPTEWWADVTFDVHDLSSERGICVSASVRVPPVGSLAGGPCGYQVACASGSGALQSYEFFGLGFVYFLGKVAIVVGGDQSMDASTCVPGMGLLAA